MRPNKGVQVAYQRYLDKLLAPLHAQVVRAVRSVYAPEAAKIAQDAATPAQILADVLKAIADRWLHQMDVGAKRAAEHFAKSARERSDKAFEHILDQSGFVVDFVMTPAMRDILDATIEENVGLIKSIPAKYLADVQGSVMRSVQAGRDLATMTKELRHHYGVSKRRAAFIALDQNNKATGAMNRARKLELGIKESIWRHSHGGEKPRPTHLANDGKKYDTEKGWYDPAVKQYIFPGQLPNCRCQSLAVIPGFT